jgi:hypothetical protein
MLVTIFNIATNQFIRMQLKKRDGDPVITLWNVFARVANIAVITWLDFKNARAFKQRLGWPSPLR